MRCPIPVAPLRRLSVLCSPYSGVACGAAVTQTRSRPAAYGGGRRRCAKKSLVGQPASVRQAVVTMSGLGIKIVHPSLEAVPRRLAAANYMDRHHGTLKGRWRDRRWGTTMTLKLLGEDERAESKAEQGASKMASAESHWRASGQALLTVVIITQEDPLYIPHFFRSFCRMLPANAGRIAVREVVILPSFGETKLQLAKRMLGFYGWVDFLRLSVRYTRQKWLSLLERLRLRKEPVSIAGICRKHGIAVRREADINREAFIQHIPKAEVDLIVSVSAPQIFQQALLEAPRYGCINIHNGRLPDYRGMLPNFWQMRNGEQHSITTIHTMARRLDAGAVVWEETTSIRPGMTLDALIRETKEKSADALWRVLGDLAQHQSFTILREIEEDGSYYSFPKFHDAVQLRASGHALL
jgi:methionyl-tRNA formyltransferase